MKAALFHFMNMLRVPFMFATKVLLWFFAFGMILAWGEYFGWFALGLKAKDPFATAIVCTFLAVGFYYFRWQYDVLLVRLNPNGEIIGYAKGGSHIVSQNEIKQK